MEHKSVFNVEIDALASQRHQTVHSVKFVDGERNACCEVFAGLGGEPLTIKTASRSTVK